MRQTLSVSLGERVASDWRCRCAIASPRLLLPIPKGEPRQAYTTQRNTTQRQQRRRLQAKRYASLGHASVRWPTLHERRHAGQIAKDKQRCTERNSSERCP